MAARPVLFGVAGPAIGESCAGPGWAHRATRDTA